MRRSIILTILVGGFVTAITWACGLFKYGDAQTADFVVKVTLSIGTLSAVVCALFGDWLREFCEPVRVKIGAPQENNNILDDYRDERDGQVYKSFCHHLEVINCTPQKPLENCRVWLKKISVEGLDGEWDNSRTKFAVPRLMEWAPSDYSRDKRTFSKRQVFDLGMTLSSNRGFRLTIERDQGGNFNRFFNVGQKIKLVFVVTADNYTRSEESSFEIVVPQSQGAADTVTRSLVTFVTD
jgi:hypothetical protein